MKLFKVSMVADCNNYYVIANSYSKAEELAIYRATKLPYYSTEQTTVRKIIIIAEEITDESNRTMYPELVINKP